MSLLFPAPVFAGGLNGLGRFITSEITQVDGKSKAARSLEFDKRLEKVMIVGVVGTVTARLIAKDVGKTLHKKLRHMGVKDYQQVKKDANTPIWEYKSDNPVGKPKPKNLKTDPTIRW